MKSLLNATIVLVCGGLPACGPSGQGLPPVVEAEDVVGPGESLTLIDVEARSLAGGVPDERVHSFTGESEDNTTFGCNVSIGDKRRIGARAQALVIPFKPSRCGVYRAWDFLVSDGGEYSSTVHAQFAGEVDLRGVMLAIGWGSASVSVQVTLLDLGQGRPGEDAVGTPVYTETVYQKDLVGGFGRQAGLSFGAEGGAAFAGLQVTAAGTIGFPLRVRKVEERLRFSFLHLVQRGNTYRVQVELRTATRADPVGDPAFSCFRGEKIRPEPDPRGEVTHATAESERAEIPDPLHPGFWLDAVLRTVQSSPPNLTALPMEGFPSAPMFTFPRIEVDVLEQERTFDEKDVFLEGFPTQLVPTVADVAEVRASLAPGLVPWSFDEVFTTRLATRGAPGGDPSRTVSVDEPGLSIRKFSILIASDPAEEFDRLLDD